MQGFPGAGGEGMGQEATKWDRTAWPMTREAAQAASNLNQEPPLGTCWRGTGRSRGVGQNRPEGRGLGCTLKERGGT